MWKFNPEHKKKRYFSVARYERLLMEDPNNFFCWRDLSITCCYHGEYERAIECAKKALEIAREVNRDPRQECIAQGYLAYSLFCSGKFKESREVIFLALESSEWLGMLGFFLFRLTKVIRASKTHLRKGIDWVDRRLMEVSQEEGDARTCLLLLKTRLLIEMPENGNSRKAIQSAKMAFRLRKRWLICQLTFIDAVGLAGFERSFERAYRETKLALKRFPREQAVMAVAAEYARKTSRYEESLRLAKQLYGDRRFQGFLVEAMSHTVLRDLESARLALMDYCHADTKNKREREVRFWCAVVFLRNAYREANEFPPRSFLLLFEQACRLLREVKKERLAGVQFRDFSAALSIIREFAPV